jgi:AraC-like DNA-binding protein
MKHTKPISFKIPKLENKALLVQIDEGQYFYDHLHYHPQLQLTAIVQGDGIFYAGNSMASFTANDVFLIGANVPHLLKCSNAYYSDKSQGVKGVSLFFDESSFGKLFFEINELKSTKKLLTDSNRVIKISGAPKQDVFEGILHTQSAKNEHLVISFLKTLSLINNTEKEYINSEQYKPTLNKNEGSKLNLVLDYTFRNYKKEIKIEEVAKIAFLSRSQFSYFFKVHTGKTYITFLNELRIENACISLKENNHTIEQICYEVGFQNVSNFIRHFKRIKSVTPSTFRKSWVI